MGLGYENAASWRGRNPPLPTETFDRHRSEVKRLVNCEIVSTEPAGRRRAIARALKSLTGSHAAYCFRGILRASVPSTEASNRALAIFRGAKAMRRGSLGILICGFLALAARGNAQQLGPQTTPPAATTPATPPPSAPP